MSARTLDEWLLYQEKAHPNSIDLGLERVQAVWLRMRADGLGIQCPVIVVGGTNGKGSTIAYLEAIYKTAGYKTVAYTSPHIDQYNERIRISGTNVSDEQLIEAFEHIDKIRAETSLSYFEYGTLAALFTASMEEPDILLLEVGLGGRLDAVNILQHDVAIVTNISLDHTEWLGESLEEIALEKAGIARQGKPFIIADTDSPESLYQYADKIGAEQMRLGRDIKIKQEDENWSYEYSGTQYMELPLPGIQGTHQLCNAAAAVCAVNCLHSRLPVEEASIRSALAHTTLKGRFEKVAGAPAVYLDVAHNLASIVELRNMLQNLECPGKLIGVFAMQTNRKIEPLIEIMIDELECWHVADMANGAGHSAMKLSEVILKLRPAAHVQQHINISAALAEALQGADPGDCIIVFGSFYTVSEARAALHV